MTRARLVLGLLLASACSRSGGAPSPRPASTDAAASTDAPVADAQLRADCERVLAHTWKLIGGDPDSDKLTGAKHEREVAECMAHLTPAARDCVLAATSDDQIKPCESLAK